MKNRIGIFLLASCFVLALGGVSFAKETTKITYSTEFNHALPSVVASVVSLDVINIQRRSEYDPLNRCDHDSYLDTNFIVTNQTITSDHFIVNPLALEVRDPHRLHDYKADYKNIPTPKVRQLKAQKLIRLILKHPSNI